MAWISAVFREQKISNLYKCISFSAEYWSYIARESRIRFATIAELLTGNDKEEFAHRWDSNSPSFRYVADEIRHHYDLLYRKTVILSMGQSPSHECWAEYCRDGGVRYEFEFNADYQKTSDVTGKHVAYNDNKTFSLANYMIQREISEDVRELFQSTEPRNAAGNIALLRCLSTQEPKDITLDHAANEIPFKKKKRFSFEDEYRFVHLTSAIGPSPLVTQLEDQKVRLEELGLKLIRISTSDVSRVKCEIPSLEVEVSAIEF